MYSEKEVKCVLQNRSTELCKEKMHKFRSIKEVTQLIKKFKELELKLNSVVLYRRI